MMNDRLITWFSKDEHPRRYFIGKIRQAETAFEKDGTVTAGNSSGINDGAAAMLLASEDAVTKFKSATDGYNCVDGSCRS